MVLDPEESPWGSDEMDSNARRGHVCAPIDAAKRISIIYNFKVHGMTIKDLATLHGLNYCTIRHIVAQYEMFGRTNQRRFRLEFPKSEGAPDKQF